MAKDEQLTPKEPIKKKSGFFKKFFLFFLVPLTFAIAVLLVVTQLLDVNIFNMKNADIPFVTSEKEKTKEAAANNDKKVLELQGVIAEKDAQIADVQAQLDAEKKAIEKLEVEKEKKAFEEKKAAEQSTAAGAKPGEVGQPAKNAQTELIKTYETMSAKAAAPIIVKMSDIEAIRILSSLKPDKVAAIFEKMTPEEAAKYSSLLGKQ